MKLSEVKRLASKVKPVNMTEEVKPKLPTQRELDHMLRRALTGFLGRPSDYF